MSKYSKINFVYFLQKWMDSVPGQTFLNYAYSWGAAVVILGTLFKLTHLPGANVMLFLGMGTEVVVFFISAFDRPFDKTTIDMDLDNHMADNVINSVAESPLGVPSAQPVQPAVVAAQTQQAVSSVAQQQTVQPASQPPGFTGGNGGSEAVSGGRVIGSGDGIVNSGGGTVGGTVVVGGGVPSGGTIIIGGGNGANANADSHTSSINFQSTSKEEQPATSPQQTTPTAAQTITPAPAVSQETAAEMEIVTKAYIERLAELNEMLEKVGQLTSRLSTDSEEMENLNRTLTGIARVYEMQLKSASQQITTQDSINEQTRIMAQKIQELNNIYTRMIEAMTVNMPGGVHSS